LVVTRGTLEDHLVKLKEVLRRLHGAGLKVNAAKSFVCTHEIEYLGYILTREGIKPQPKKVQAILALIPPHNVKELQHFQRSEMLAPLSDLVGECGATKNTRKNKVKKTPWHWDSLNVKSTIAKEVVLAYPSFLKPLEIYTDASTLQLGAVITQENRPIAFFSRKLSGAQSKYTITKLDLLAIVETLKEFNGMLWGQRINVYTDHKNLTRDGLGLTSNRITRWRILLEEYAPEIIYIKGIHNTVADAISQLEYDPKLNSTNEYNYAMHVRSANKEANQKWLMYSKFCSRYHETQGDLDEGKMILLNQCFTNRNEEDEIYPLTVKEIVEAQKADSTLKQYFKRNAVQDNGLELLLYRKRKLHMPQRSARIAKALTKLRSYVVSPLSSAPWAYPSRRDNEICDLPERNEKLHPIQNKVMQDLPIE